MYPYITEDNRKNRQYYMYSTYNGEQFLADFKNIRTAAILELSTGLDKRPLEILNNAEYTLKFIIYRLSLIFAIKSENAISEENFHMADFAKGELPKQTDQLLESILMRQLVHDSNDEIDKILSMLLKSFEVHKRVFSAYDQDFKPVRSEDFLTIYPYVLLAVAIGLHYLDTNNLKFLNALLKLNDTLLSVRKQMILAEEEILTYFALRIEQQAVLNLCQQKQLAYEQGRDNT